MDGTIQSQRTDSSKLVQRFQDGEREAFDALVNLYQHRVLKLTYQFTRNPEDAADLAQEAFLRAFQGLESFQGKSLNRFRIADCGLQNLNTKNAKTTRRTREVFTNLFRVFRVIPCPSWSNSELRIPRGDVNDLANSKKGTL